MALVVCWWLLIHPPLLQKWLSSCQPRGGTIFSSWITIWRMQLQRGRRAVPSSAAGIEPLPSTGDKRPRKRAAKRVRIVERVDSAATGGSLSSFLQQKSMYPWQMWTIRREKEVYSKWMTWRAKQGGGNLLFLFIYLSFFLFSSSSCRWFCRVNQVFLITVIIFVSSLARSSWSNITGSNCSMNNSTKIWDFCTLCKGNRGRPPGMDWCV